MKLPPLEDLIPHLVPLLATMALSWVLYGWMQKTKRDLREHWQRKSRFVVPLFYLAWIVGSGLIYWLLGVETQPSH